MVLMMFLCGGNVYREAVRHLFLPVLCLAPGSGRTTQVSRKRTAWGHHSKSYNTHQTRPLSVHDQSDAIVHVVICPHCSLLGRKDFFETSRSFHPIWTNLLLSSCHLHLSFKLHQNFEVPLEFDTASK